MSGFPVLIFWSGPPGPIWHFCLPAGPLRKLKISQKRNYMPPYCILGAKKHWEMRTLQNVPALTVSLPHNVARPCSSNFQWRWYVHDPQKIRSLGWHLQCENDQVNEKHQLLPELFSIKMVPTKMMMLKDEITISSWVERCWLPVLVPPDPIMQRLHLIPCLSHQYNVEWAYLENYKCFHFVVSIVITAITT